MLKTGGTSWAVILAAPLYLLLFHFLSQARWILKVSSFFFSTSPHSFLSKLTENYMEGLWLPPGPPSRPIIRNVFDMSTDHPWETFMKWGKMYGEFLVQDLWNAPCKHFLGDLVYIEVFGWPILFVNSTDVANDLFKRKSLIYSDCLISLWWTICMLTHLTLYPV